jgi:flagellar motor switch protein FliM
MTSGGRAVQRGAMYVLRFETATPNKANETVNITVPPAMVKPILSRVVMEVYSVSYLQNQ